ncbi:hypothetical protein C8R46DRAFT_1040914 [Mycena filopes]|nr:hypothetical protein C8R46DRAFT_1040914 [Mycena filopes]
MPIRRAGQGKGSGTERRDSRVYKESSFSVDGTKFPARVDTPDLFSAGVLSVECLVVVLVGISCFTAYSPSTHFNVEASPALITVTAPQAETASDVIVGSVDSLGRTAYLIPEDQTQGRSTVEFLTATLVAGADHTFYTIAASSAGLDLIVGFVCGISGGNAICSDVDKNSKLVTITLSGEGFVLDITTTAPVGGSKTRSGFDSATPTSQPSDG